MSHAGPGTPGLRQWNRIAWVSAIMPTVHRWSGYSFIIYTNDHRPSHIHVIRGRNDAEAVFALHCPDGPPELQRNYGLSIKEAQQVAEQISGALTHLCNKWKDIHGRY